MSKNYAIIIHFMLPPTTFYRSGAHRSDVYKWDAFVTSWRFYNRAWQPQRHDRLPETSGTLWIHRGALTNKRCSLATGVGLETQPRSLWRHCKAKKPRNTSSSRASYWIPYLLGRILKKHDRGITQNIPDSNVHGANMGPTWVLSAPDGPHVGPMNLAIRDE